MPRENASCGDVILLQAGATFKGPVTLPAKNCDAQHWITLRTSAADSSLPPEGTRITPCYAGISSLPARPTYSCSAPQNVLSKIQIADGAGAIIRGSRSQLLSSYRAGDHSSARYGVLSTVSSKCLGQRIT